MVKREFFSEIPTRSVLCEGEGSLSVLMLFKDYDFHQFYG
jgi:hypothetical protein